MCNLSLGRFRCQLATPAALVIMELHLGLADLDALAVVELAIGSVVGIVLELVAAASTTAVAILILQMDYSKLVVVVDHLHQMDSVQRLLCLHLHQMDFVLRYLLATVVAVAAIAAGCLVADNSSSLSFVLLILNVLIII